MILTDGDVLPNGTLFPSPTFGKSIYWSNPAGGMFSTMKDMLSFASKVATKEGVLSNNGYSRYFLPGVDLRDGITSYGRYGWEAAYSNGLRVLTKGGLIGGFGTTLVIIPELKLGAFFWVNFQSGSTPSTVCS